jgi:hypothetical protein
MTNVGGFAISSWLTIFSMLLTVVVPPARCACGQSASGCKSGGAGSSCCASVEPEAYDATPAMGCSACRARSIQEPAASGASSEPAGGCQCEVCLCGHDDAHQPLAPQNPRSTDPRVKLTAVLVNLIGPAAVAAELDLSTTRWSADTTTFSHSVRQALLQVWRD